MHIAYHTSMPGAKYTEYEYGSRLSDHVSVFLSRALPLAPLVVRPYIRACNKRDTKTRFIRVNADFKRGCFLSPILRIVDRAYFTAGAGGSPGDQIVPKEKSFHVGPLVVRCVRVEERQSAHGNGARSQIPTVNA